MESAQPSTSKLALRQFVIGDLVVAILNTSVDFVSGDKYECTFPETMPDFVRLT